MVECLTVLKLKRELNTKEMRMIKLTVLSIKFLKDNSKRKKKSIMMVVLNSLINFLFRIPEIIVIFTNSNHLVENNKLFLILCDYISICEELMSISEFFYILTFSTNFFIFYYFNNLFQKNINKTCRRISCFIDNKK